MNELIIEERTLEEELLFKDRNSLSPLVQREKVLINFNNIFNRGHLVPVPGVLNFRFGDFVYGTLVKVDKEAKILVSEKLSEESEARRKTEIKKAKDINKKNKGIEMVNYNFDPEELRFSLEKEYSDENDKIDFMYLGGEIETYIGTMDLGYDFKDSNKILIHGLCIEQKETGNFSLKNMPRRYFTAFPDQILLSLDYISSSGAEIVVGDENIFGYSCENNLGLEKTLLEASVRLEKDPYLWHKSPHWESNSSIKAGSMSANIIKKLANYLTSLRLSD